MAVVAVLVAGVAEAEPAALMFDGGDVALIVRVDTLQNVERTRRDDGMNEVYFRLSDDDADAFAALTRKIEGKTLRIIMCGTVLAAPTVLTPIEGGEVLITGGTDAGTETLFTTLASQAPCPDG